MSPSQAKATFAELMKTARSRRLTANEKRALTLARQSLRRSKRPASNPIRPLESGIGRQFRDLPIGTKFRFMDEFGRDHPAPYYKHSRFSASLGVDDSYKGQVSVPQSTRVLVEAYPLPKMNRRPASNNPSEKFLIVVAWKDERKSYAALWKVRGTDKDVAAANNYLSDEGYANGRVFTYHTRTPLAAAKNDAIQRLNSDLTDDPRRDPSLAPGGKPKKRRVRVPVRVNCNPGRKGFRIGDVTEVRYKRTVGKHRGKFYKHEFDTRPGLYLMPDKTVEIR